MNRKTLSRFVMLCLVVVMLVTTIVGSAMAADVQTSADGQFNFTSFVSGLWGENPQPAVLACEGCSGGGGGPL